MKNFSGTKVALINKGQVLVIMRDDKPDIDFPGMWDFPGGGREGDETSVQTGIRETKEELDIDLNPVEVVWQKDYEAVADPDKIANFIVYQVSQEQIDSIKLGDEGREWKMVSFNEFLAEPNAVKGMQARLKDYLAGNT